MAVKLSFTILIPKNWSPTSRKKGPWFFYCFFDVRDVRTHKIARQSALVKDLLRTSVILKMTYGRRTEEPVVTYGDFWNKVPYVSRTSFVRQRTLWR
jgi:hypothetical protein